VIRSCQSFLIPLILAGVFATAVPAAAQSDEADRVRDAAITFEEIMTAPDHGVPSAILERAEAVVVFPSTLKGGFIVAGHRGRGIMSVRDHETGSWSPPAFLTLTGGSFGAQVGGQAIDLVLLVMNRRGLEQLVRNRFKIGADASVAAGPVGRDASAATDIQLRAQILSYSRTRGLFAGVSLAGSVIRQDQNANRRYYGRRLQTRDIVFDRKVEGREPADGWHAALSRYAGATARKTAAGN
jgi:SH3 domain-containing YSC84-like protein 1